MTQNLFQLALESGLHVYFPRVEQGIEFYGAIYGGYYVTNVRLRIQRANETESAESRGVSLEQGADLREEWFQVPFPFSTP